MSKTVAVVRIAAKRPVFVSGVNIIGPTNDGMVHLHCFHERILIDKETGDVESEDAIALAVKDMRPRDGDITNARQEVAVLMMTPAMVDRLIGALQRHKDEVMPKVKKRVDA